MAKPQTYMNLSGESVRDIMNWYKADHDSLVVIYDDIDLPLGSIRIRERGSSGTHNGMKASSISLDTMIFRAYAWE